MPISSLPPWLDKPPAAYDIVTAFFPETNPKGDLRLRPCLVTHVLRAVETGDIACRVVFGTKHLKLTKRVHLDVIIQNATDLRLMGLHMATRFDLDGSVDMPWTTEFFGCWAGHKQPKIGSLTETYIRDYAFKMLSRGSA